MHITDVNTYLHKQINKYRLGNEKLNVRNILSSSSLNNFNEEKIDLF